MNWRVSRLDSDNSLVDLSGVRSERWNHKGVQNRSRPDAARVHPATTTTSCYSSTTNTRASMKEILDRIEQRPKGALPALAAVDALDEERARH